MRVYKDVIRLAQLCMVARLFSSFQSTRFWKLVFYSNKFPFLNMLLINSMPLICLIYKMAKKLKTKVRIHFLCVSSPFTHLVWSSFGSVALAMSVIISGSGRTLHIFPTHPSFPPPSLDNMQIYFGKYIFHLLWTTCRHILANTMYIFHLPFGQHANIFGQVLYFPSSF